MKRYTILDGIRGLTLLSMILYHAVWDLVYIFGKNVKWYQSSAGYLWQQSICWTFILLSGFCWSLGKQKWKRGFTVFLGGMLITGTTLFLMPDDRVIFGILTMLGTCMLLMIPLHKILIKWNPAVGMTASLLLFAVTRNINDGYLGFAGWNLLKLPQEWYRNLFTTFWGLTSPDFFSADYFSIFPWCFLFLAGYFLYWLMEKKEALRYLGVIRMPGMEWLGKHSFEIYLVHQPVLYFGMNLCFLL